MLLALAIILAIAWLFAFAVFEVGSLAVHLLILFAAVALVAHLAWSARINRRAWS